MPSFRSSVSARRVLLALGLAAFVPCSVQAQTVEKEPSESREAAHQLKASNRPKVGLALSGGGARGAAHVGVLRILEQQGIHIDYIAGTNTGAVVGGLYSAGVSIDYLEQMFTKRSLMHSYLTVPVKLRIVVIPLFYVPRMVGRKSFDGLYEGTRFRKFLNKYLPESEQDISDLKIPFGAVAVNLLDGKVNTLRSGNLGWALQASSALPVLRKPVKIGEALYVDGGVSVNLPVQQVKEMGADVVIAVSLDDEPGLTVKESEFQKVGSVSHRVLTMHLSNVDIEQRKAANIVIHPDVEKIGLMSTSARDAKAAIEAGETAALASIEQIKQLLGESDR